MSKKFCVIVPVGIALVISAADERAITDNPLHARKFEALPTPPMSGTAIHIAFDPVTGQEVDVAPARESPRPTAPASSAVHAGPLPWWAL